MFLDCQLNIPFNFDDLKNLRLGRQVFTTKSRLRKVKKQQAHIQKLQNDMTHRCDNGEKDSKIKHIRGSKPKIIRSTTTSNRSNENHECSEQYDFMSI